MIPHLRAVKVPTLNVAGWWDQEDFYGPVRIYEALEQHDTSAPELPRRRAVEPRRLDPGHGRPLGPITFGSATAKYFRDQVQAPWFAYFLKDKGRLDFPEALTFEAGSNQWRRWDAWPPQRRYRGACSSYFASRNATRLRRRRPLRTRLLSTVTSRTRLTRCRTASVRSRPRISPADRSGRPGCVEDQRFVDDRADVLSWETPPLETRRDDRRRGRGPPVRVHDRQRRRLDRQADRRLSRALPGELGPGRLPADGVERGVPRPLPHGLREAGADRAGRGPGVHLEPAHAELHVPKGHRIMVQVQSTWFPIIDRNPQTFVPSIFEARAEDFRPATHRIYRSARYPSHVSIPKVVKTAS